MNTRKFVHLVAVAALLITAFASAGNGALAWSKCPTYITVQWGDTLSGIARMCDTTVEAIRAANPGLGWWLYAGQILYIPSAGSPPTPPPTSGTYVVQRGDTLGKLAARWGSSVSRILAVNPQITNANLIYVGQVINIPAGGSVPPPTKTPPPPPTKTPAPPSGTYSTVKIAYKGGMFIRSEPNGTIIASALNRETVYYKPGSIFIDKKWRVWVEVKLFPPTRGYTTGWLLVRDQFGTNFTDPPIDP